MFSNTTLIHHVHLALLIAEIYIHDLKSSPYLNVVKNKSDLLHLSSAGIVAVLVASDVNVNLDAFTHPHFARWQAAVNTSDSIIGSDRRIIMARSRCSVLTGAEGVRS